MRYDPEDLKAVQNIEKEILKEIIRVCELLDIEYFAVGGTTLGAVRHGDFIPWDDDIDIGMMRRDYEKFLAKAPELLGQDYYLQHFGTDRNMPAYFAKVRKNGTLFVEDYFLDIDMHHGIYVDIMPYDFVPDNEVSRCGYRMKVRFWWELFVAKSVGDIFSADGGAIKKLVSLTRGMEHRMLKPVPKDWLYNRLDKALRRYENEETQTVSSRGYRHWEAKYTDILPARPCRFGELEIRIPKCAEKILKIQYGDYMQLPPEEKRVNHRPVKLDTGRALQGEVEQN